MKANLSTIPLRDRIAGILRDGALAPDDRLPEYAVDGCLPQAVAFPSSEQQLSAVLVLATSEGLTVMLRGSGGFTTLGNLPRSVDLVLGTTRLEPLIDHRPDDLTVTVAAGVTLGTLQAKLTEAGQWLPLDPPLAPRRTIGGILATGLSGPLTLSQGTPRDMVIGMRVASPGGEVTKSGGTVVKNVTGFDLPKAHIGALGTLGVILQASFKVWPLPGAETTLMASYSSLASAIGTVQELLALPVAPVAAEVVQQGGNPTAYLRFFGMPAGVRRRVEAAGGLLRDSGADSMETLSQEDAPQAWRRIADLGWEPRQAESVTLLFGCLPSRIGELAGAVEAVALQRGTEYSLAVGPGRGTLRCLISGVSDAADTVERLRGLASSVDGYAVVERCPLALKAHLDVWGHPGSALPLMRRLKERIDPDRILNRGRYVGGI